MLGRVITAAGVFSLMVAPAQAQPAAAEIDGLFANWSASDKPGCAVGVARDGKTIFERAYGSADLEHGVPNRTDTIFEAGSVSKQFTAAAILMLAEEKKLSLSDDIRKYFPELPAYPQAVTIDHLLSHTSGLRDWGAIAGVYGWPRGTRAATNNDVLVIAARQKSLNYAPGSEYSYTNTGYNLMAMIVESVSGSTLADFTRDRLFKPLGMANTSWRDDFRRVVKNRAIAYDRSGDGYRQDMPFEDAYGNGGLLTTTGDLLIWNQALDSGRLGPFLTAELPRRAVLTTGPRITYARGLFVGQHKGRDEIQHGGATGAYRAWLGRYPSEKLSVALLCNAGDVASASLGQRIADRFLPALAAAPAAIATPPNMTSRAGMFVNERTGMPLHFVMDGDRLRVEKGPVLEVVSVDRLRSEGLGEIVFQNADLFLLHNMEGETVRFRRALAAQPKPADLVPLAGSYRSEEADVSYLVALKDGELLLQHEGRPHILVKLAPSYKDAFQTPGGIVRFYRDKSGKVTELGIGIPRLRDLRFQRR